ncbi:hypothetical protein VSS74_18965 [Conexibacter stalactiti]|uniref:Uncharacterized protein n=1 Tax=Conexibacter stalactiti TaxID=1940611 RepID=A0ABU4HSZ1_9ACTN|nr:hypothetical protein [Conexibacter stalactiti]MDW5596436.1 hypothetical protein [Conexibacter stalactiti]MEC5037078.1 hypothetical protein [Conexibacter stalactiti]
MLRGVGTDAARLAELAAAVAPGHRRVVPEPPRFLYVGRDHVGQRWWVTSIDGEHEPATFGDALHAVEQLAAGIRAQWAAPSLLVGDGQGGELALALALIAPELVAGVVALDAALPQVPGWERPAAALDGLPVLLLPGAQPSAEIERTRRELLAAGARLSDGPPGIGAAEAALAGPPGVDADASALAAGWWREAAPAAAA